MMTEPVRNFIGYGGNPTDPKWPNDARLALNFVMNFEEGSEPSFDDGDGFTEAALTEVGPQGLKGRDLAAESQFEYGSRIGFWRIHRIFQERQLPLTVFACALALERNPPAAKAIAQAGYDLCCHGYRWEKHYEMEPDAERECIGKARSGECKRASAPGHSVGIAAAMVTWARLRSSRSGLSAS